MEIRHHDFMADMTRVPEFEVRLEVRVPLHAVVVGEGRDDQADRV